MKSRYYFGRVPAKQIDCFAYPRTGSHLLNYCCQGLFDLVWFPTPGIDLAEAVDRERELEPASLYALGLREDGSPYTPVYIDHRANGQHGLPVKTDHPVIILTRDPVATVYSFYRVAAARWGMADRMGDAAAWVGEKLARYHAFCERSRAILEQHAAEAMLIRFEDLVSSPATLARLVEFVGVKPKLSPEFVFRHTRFDTLVRPGNRTFYRAGTNDAWREDPSWCALLDRVSIPDFTPFGYPLREHSRTGAGP